MEILDCPGWKARGAVDLSARPLARFVSSGLEKGCNPPRYVSTNEGPRSRPRNGATGLSGSRQEWTVCRDMKVVEFSPDGGA